MYKTVTNHPIAHDSRDHTHPGGTMMDNSRNQRFNNKMYAMFPEQKLTVLDMGCSGGGFVKNCVEDGHEAVGIEGSDYSLIRKRAEWGTIPERLFTVDITKPFEILGGESDACCTRVQFDIITAWEVMEHIPESGLHQLCENVKIHLKDTGYWIMSVSTQTGFHHVTVKNRKWWLDMFDREGFYNNQKIVESFGNDRVRGPHQKAPQSFHLILRKKGNV